MLAQLQIEGDENLWNRPKWSEVDKIPKLTLKSERKFLDEFLLKSADDVIQSIEEKLKCIGARKHGKV